MIFIYVISIITLPYDIDAQTPDAKTLDSHTLDGIVNKTNVFNGNSQINVGADPESIAISLDTDKVYVANTGSGTVSVIDGTNNTKVKDIPVGKSARSIAVDTDTNKVYVANYASNSISVIDGKTNVKKGDIPVGKSPIYIAVDTTRNKVYVANTHTFAFHT